jgi:spore coat polysaccharide biosynthesis protein SpsF (cytidylyltransferase family)
MPGQVHAIAVIDLGDFTRPEVQATASRFAQRRLGGQTLIMRMARRVTECELIDAVYVVGSNVPSSLLNGGIPGVESMNLPSMHTCERLAMAADTADTDWVVYLPANRPFVDAVLVDQLVSAASRAGDCDYVGYGSEAGDCTRMQQLGLAGEVCHIDTLRRLRRNADRLSSDSQRGMIANWLGNAPGAYHLKFIPLPTALDRDDLRFAVEDETDWDDVELLCETVSDDDSQWEQLTQLVSTNNDLRKSMESRNG